MQVKAWFSVPLFWGLRWKMSAFHPVVSSIGSSGWKPSASENHPPQEGSQNPPLGLQRRRSSRELRIVFATLTDTHESKNRSLGFLLPFQLLIALVIILPVGFGGCISLISRFQTIQSLFRRTLRKGSLQLLIQLGILLEFLPQLTVSACSSRGPSTGRNGHKYTDLPVTNSRAKG